MAVNNYNRLFDMLPTELKCEENALIFKEILKIYSGHADSGDILNECYGYMLDIDGATGEEVDLVGAMYGLFRIQEVKRARSIWRDATPHEFIQHVTYVDSGKIIGWSHVDSEIETYYSQETDEEFKFRIARTVTARKIPTTIPELQQAIDSTVTSGALYVFENHNNLPGNIYLTGTADEASIRASVGAIKDFLPAGVRLVIAVVQFSTWWHIKNQYVSWESMSDLGAIW